VTYETDKVSAGGERIDIIRVKQNGCSLTFGVAPCTATGVACCNSWETCKDPNNYADTDKWFQFCTPVSKMPAGMGLIPFIAKDGVSFDPADLTPEDGIGKIGSGSVKFIDAPHDDVGIDPYVGTRGYSTLDRGTLWPRLRARWPNWQGRILEWYTGYLSFPFDLANLQKRTMVVEEITGFGGKYGVELKFADPLQLADDKRAVWPRKSTGTLTNAMTDSETPTTIDITTSDTDEYDLEDYETIGCVAMKEEVFQYTGTTIVTGGIRLTGVTRSAPYPYDTAQVSHEAGDEVQKCAYFDDLPAPTILGKLLILGAGADPAWVPYATTWQTLYSTWLGSLTITRLITQPEGVRSLLTEVLTQSSGWGLWWDDVNEVFGYEIYRPAALGESVTTITDGSNVVENSITISDDSARLLNYVTMRFGQVDPTKPKDDVSNYAMSVVSLDLSSISEREVGGERIREVFANWHPESTSSLVGRLGDRLVTARASIPFVVTFDVMRKDDALRTGQFIDLTTTGLRDQYGNQRTLRMRVTKADYGKNLVRYTAREDFVSNRYGLIAPDSLAGVTWTTATAAQRATYVFIADANGLMSDGSEGKRIF